MPDKPTLTLETALAVFPEECKAILFLDSDFEKDENGNPFARDEEGSLIFATEQSLVYRALQWLAGKEVLLPLLSELKRDIDLSRRSLVEVSATWPDDPLRWFLEEVRAQLKQEREDGA